MLAGLGVGRGAGETLRQRQGKALGLSAWEPRPSNDSGAILHGKPRKGHAARVEGEKGRTQRELS
jgi:hypothetical protein